MRRGIKGLSACMLAIAALLSAGTFAVRAADDAKTCIKESGDVAIDACSRAIKSGHTTGHTLARQYLSRGVERRAKEDYDLALADFAEALKVDKKYADAFFNRCSIYNFKKEYDHAITECSHAIKLGTPITTECDAERPASKGCRESLVHPLSRVYTARDTFAVVPARAGTEHILIFIPHRE